MPRAWGLQRWQVRIAVCVAVLVLVVASTSTGRSLKVGNFGLGDSQSTSRGLLLNFAPGSAFFWQTCFNGVQRQQTHLLHVQY